MAIVTTGTLGDLNSNGSNADEMAVLDCVTKFWSMQVPTNSAFSMTISEAYNGTTGDGGITAFDASDRPTAGALTVGTAITGYGWYVDPTPNDNSEFTQDPAHPYIYRNGPQGNYLDLKSHLNHEFAHALAMHGDPNNMNFNPRYQALVNWLAPDLCLNLAGGCIALAGRDSINDVSHFTPLLMDLMGSPRPVFDGAGVLRVDPSPWDIEVVRRVQRSHTVNVEAAQPSPVPEPGTLVLVGAVLLTFGLKKRAH